jgi:hypothetical protein
MSDKLFNDGFYPESVKLHMDDVNKLCGLNLIYNDKISASKNFELLNDECDAFWKKISDDAYNFLSELEKSIKSNSKSSNLQSDIFLFPENINSFVDLKIHPFSVILIADRMRDETLKKAKKLIPSLGGKNRAKLLDEATNRIKDSWASGIFLSRELCAEKQWQQCGFKTEGTARRKLRNTPDPHPWPAKKLA